MEHKGNLRKINKLALYNENLEYDQIKSVDNTKIVKPERESNIELLRIILFILITLHHFALYTKISEISVFTSSVCKWGGKISVILFLIISGYYMVNSKFKIKKIINLWAQVFFYSVGLLIICYIIEKPSDMGKIEYIKFLLPISSSKYGFISKYFYLYILSPFIIKMINSIKKEYFQKFLILSGCIFLLSNNFIIGANIEYFENIFGYIFFFLVGCYIKKYGLKHFEKNSKRNMIISIIIILTYIVLTYLKQRLGINNSAIINDIFSRMVNLEVNSIFTLYCAISIFYYFLKSIKIKNKTINYIASCSLSIYLVQEQPMFRKVLWERIFDVISVNKNTLPELINANANILNKICAIPSCILASTINCNASKLFVIYAFIATIIILISAIAIETVRKLTLGKIVNNVLNLDVIDKNCKKIDNWMNK